MSHSQAPASFNAGYSICTAAWPLVEKYQGHNFQSGLYGTWMFAQHDGREPDTLYSDIEGDLGWWTDTRSPTETPKFIMGGVGPNFSVIANGPSHGSDDGGLYGVAQQSDRHRSFVYRAGESLASASSTSVRSMSGTSGLLCRNKPGSTR